MSASTSGRKEEGTDVGAPHDVDDDLYHYKDAGISEHHGRIPVWLVLVAVGLIVWGIYYTVRYWSAP